MLVSEFQTAAESVLDKEFKASQPAALLQSELLLWVGEAYGIIVDALREYVGSTDIAVVNGQVAYDLPAALWGDVNNIIAVVIGTTDLQREFLPDLIRRHRGLWTTVGGKSAPCVWLKEGDADKFSIRPAPTSGTITVYYLKAPTIPSATSDSVPRYFTWHKTAIVNYLIYKGREKTSPGSGQQAYEKFQELLGLRAKDITFNSRQEDVNKAESPRNV